MKTALPNGAAELLLAVLESPQAFISAEALALADPTSGEALIECGALVAHGYEPTIAAIGDHSDRPVSLARSDRGNGYGYFSPTSGWIEVPTDSLRRYRVDLRAAMAAMMPLSMKLTPVGRQRLIEGHLWSIGTIGSGKWRLEVLFSRQLADPMVRQRVQAFFRDSPTPGRCVLLTSTSSSRLPPRDFLRTTVVPIGELMDPSIGSRITAEALFGRTADDGPVTEPLWLSSDGSQLRVHGGKPIMFRGSKQRRLIRLLVDAYRRGERLSAGHLLENAGSGSHSVPKAFGPKKWALLNSHLKCHDDVWGFEV